MNIPDFATGLLPTIIQDSNTGTVLMLGYMNAESYEKTIAEGRVTFFSRSKNRLWTKGETSGNFLNVQSIQVDCDNDTLLIQASPTGPVCHTGAATCFTDTNKPADFLQHLEQIISNRKDNPDEKSYTSSLFARGINKIAQKVGEEAVELVIEAKDSNDELFLGEAADLLFHYLILLKARGKNLESVVDVLKQRHSK